MTMTDKREHPYLALMLFIISIVIRVLLISKGPYHDDCLRLAILAEKTLETGTLQHLFGPGYPLTVLLGALFVFLARLCGVADPVTAVNFMSVVFSSLCIPVNFALVKRMFGERAAVFSSIMLSIFPIFLVISVYGKSHAPSLFFLLAGAWLLVKDEGEPKKRNLALSALCLGLMGAARIQDLALMVIPISCLFLFPVSPGHKPRTFSLLTGFWALISGIALCFHLPLLFSAQNGSFLKQLDNFWQLGVTTNFLGLLSSSFVFSLQNVVFGLTPIGALLAVAGLLMLIPKNRNAAIFLFLWFLVPLIFYGNLSTTAPRFLVISIIPLIVAQGYGFARLTTTDRIPVRYGMIAVFAVIVTLLFSHIYPILEFRHKHALLPDFGRYVAAVTPPQSRVIPGDEGAFIQYYGKRKTLRRPRAAAAFDPKELVRFRSRVDRLLAKDVPLYITGSGLRSYDPGLVFSTMMNERFRLTLIGERLTEDWHKGGTRLRTGMERLYRIEPR